MKRPDDVFDREEEWRSLERFCEADSPGATLGVVLGRRRQGKSYLLEAACEQTGGFYFQATEATSSESLRLLGTALGKHLSLPAPLAFDDWATAVDALLDLGRAPKVVVIDEFPYLKDAAPELPSIIQAAFGPRRAERRRSKTRLILCGSALSVMGGLMSGAAPLRGRASMELPITTFDYRLARRFWGIDDPKLAVLTHAVVGGTPAYAREYVHGDRPRQLADFDKWVVRAVLDPGSPLLKEARYLLNEEPEFRDRALYHSVLAAVAEGHRTRGAIANRVGKQTTDLAHSLTVLEDSGFVVKDDDVFRDRRPVWRIAEPLVTFYHAIMRPSWGQLERPGRAAAVWNASKPIFESTILGPHFEQLCRYWAERYAAPATFGAEEVSEVGQGVINDSKGKAQHEVDVAVIQRTRGGRRIASLGEAKWGETMGVEHVARLEKIKTLISAGGDLDASAAVLVCYSGRGFTPALVSAANARADIALVGIDRLYEGE